MFGIILKKIKCSTSWYHIYMGFVLICITIGGHEHELSQNFLQFWIALKYIFRHILLIISTCDLELFRKLPKPIGNIMWKLKDHSYSSKRAILPQSWHFDIRKNSILCIKRRLVSRYIAPQCMLWRNIGSYIQVFRVTYIPGTMIISDALNMRGQRSKVTELWLKM